MMIGGYTDAVFGRIDAASYFEVVPPTFTANVDSLENTTYDSIALLLKPNGGYTGDTSQPLRIRVERLAQSIAPYDNNLSILYNTDAFAVTGTPLAQQSTTIQIGRAVQQECRDRSRMPSSA
eukprot:TRINITY_DN32459_c0_g1_i1.p2 TRINITY_DN32459_c0_g1~~TRINITY_DN32459_c0_g1_i1.p2  ORF type:complete len:122 (-),score=22.57 TRINITY_DN32459_c0_g1_i1:11-376(-)